MKITIRLILMVLFLCGNAYCGQMNRNTHGLLRLLHLNENEGTAPKDEVTGSTAILDGGSWVTGIYGSAIDFGVNSEEIQVPASTGIIGSENWTIMMWFIADSLDNPTDGCNSHGAVSAGDGQTLLSIMGGGTGKWAISAGIIKAGGMFVDIDPTAEGTGTVPTSAGEGMIARGKWYHVAFVGRNTPEVIEFWVLNSTTSTKMVSAAVTNSRIAAAGGSSRSTWIGAMGNTTACHFLGRMDEVALFNRALSKGELESIHNAQMGRYPSFAD